MNALARNVRLEIGEDETRLAGNTLYLAADQVSMLTGRTTTEWWWGVLAVLLGLVVYTFSTVFILGFEKQDWWFVSAIVAFTLVLYWFGRAFSPRLAPPVTQGYWDAVKTPFDT
jgi:cytochrome bd-type quinol oxidase subunit 2